MNANLKTIVEKIDNKLNMYTEKCKKHGIINHLIFILFEWKLYEDPWI